jgi:hypothetical protein
MNAVSHWKKGLGIMGRLIYLSIFLFFATIPVRIIGLIPIEWNGIDSYIIAVYCIIVIPIVLSRVFPACGLESRSTGSFDEGGMNEASQRKSEELKRESKVSEAGTL